jgi:ankyrin repeat protein
MNAALYGKTETAKLLLLAGADVTKQDVRGRTAMAFAVATDTQEIMKLLRDNGAGE